MTLVTDELRTKLNRSAELTRIINELDMESPEEVFTESRELREELIPRLSEFMELVAQSGLLSFHDEVGEIEILDAVAVDGRIRINGDMKQLRFPWCEYSPEVLHERNRRIAAEFAAEQAAIWQQRAYACAEDLQAKADAEDDGDDTVYGLGFSKDDKGNVTVQRLSDLPLGESAKKAPNRDGKVSTEMTRLSS